MDDSKWPGLAGDQDVHFQLLIFDVGGIFFFAKFGFTFLFPAFTFTFSHKCFGASNDSC